MEKDKFSTICVWIQAQSIHDDDIVICDGKKIPNGNDHDRMATFAIAIHPSYRLIGVINNIKIYEIPNEGFLLMSNLKNKDEVNRKRAFSAIIRNGDFNKSWKVLNTTLNSFDLFCEETDYQLIAKCIEEYKEKKKRTEHFFKICILILIAFIMCWIILKKI